MGRTVIEGLDVELGLQHLDYLRGIDEAITKTKSAESTFRSLGTVLSAVVSGPLILLGGAAIKAAVSFDSLRRGMIAVAGSAKAADEQLARLKKVAELPGL